MQLQYLSAPAPAYPRMAMKRGLTGTVRRINAQHRFAKLDRISAITY